MLRPALLVLLSTLLVLRVGFAQSVEDHGSEALQAKSRSATGRQAAVAAEATRLIVEQTNEFRREQHRQPVEMNSELTKTADYFADYMARTNKYGHRADGRGPSDRAKEHGYDYCLITENIAYQYNSEGFTAAELAKRLVNGWKNSPGHRMNMIDRDVLETGVAVAQSADNGYWYAVQLFGRPKSAAIQFKVSNDSNSTVEYKLDDHMFPLLPGYTRTHTRCRRSDLIFDIPGTQAGSKKVRPRSGDHLLIARENDQLSVQRK